MTVFLAVLNCLTRCVKKSADVNLIAYFLFLLSATAIGANCQAAHSILKADYTENMSILDAKKLAVKVLKQTMDSTTLLPEKVEMCEISFRIMKSARYFSICCYPMNW